MPNVRDVMTRRLATVALDDTVRAAMELLRREQLDVLPVVSDGALVGSVAAIHLFRFYGEMPLREALGPPLPTISPDAALGAAAAVMGESGARALVVVRGEEPIGLLTERDLADSWGSIPDPLTGLPWQDQMRRWAAAHLSRSREIAILFLDLNGFGDFNKQHGHVLGDGILRGVALALQDAVDPEQDFLCRYGGDEFVVATLRPLVQARALAMDLRRGVAEVQLDGAEVAVSAAIGVSGGQRAAQRPGAHPPATLDDLINLASRASTEAKGLPDQCYAVHGGRGAVDARFSTRRGRDPEVRTVAEGYQVTQRGGEVSVSVSLRRAAETGEATSTRPVEELRRAIGEAAIGALSRFLPDDLTLELAEVTTCATGTCGEVAGAAVILTPADGAAEPLFGTAPLLSDPARSIINAVLDATNRRLGYWLARAAPAGAARLKVER